LEGLAAYINKETFDLPPEGLVDQYIPDITLSTSKLQTDNPKLNAMQILHTLLATACLAGSTCAHGRIKYPRPINAPPDTPDGNAYNAPLKADGSEFPCKNLHKTISLYDPALKKTKWQAGQPTYFE
jgi:hypothetical protein